MHDAPPTPHAALALPVWQSAPAQQPAHDVASHTQVVPLHRWPPAHVPVAHTPPQPSLAPQAFPPQLGVHPHVPTVPPPPHVDGEAQTEHTPPPLPHAVWSPPARHALPSQQPGQDVESQMHAPAAQRVPLPHAPVEHTPLHPSLSPHAFPAQLGAHGPLPQRFGPVAPHVSAAGHAAHLRIAPHRPFSSPHFPAQSAASFGTHCASGCPPSGGGGTVASVAGGRTIAPSAAPASTGSLGNSVWSVPLHAGPRSTTSASAAS